MGIEVFSSVNLKAVESLGHSRSAVLVGLFYAGYVEGRMKKAPVTIGPVPLCDLSRSAIPGAGNPSYLM